MDFNNIIPLEDGSELQRQQQLHEQNQQLKRENTRLEALAARQLKTIENCQESIEGEQNIYIAKMKEYDLLRNENTRLEALVTTQGEIARWMEQVDHTCQQNEIAMDANMVLVMCNKGTIVKAEETKASIITRNQNLLTRTNTDLHQVLFWMKNEIARLDDER
jgi:hypothetical protein